MRLNSIILALMSALLLNMTAHAADPARFFSAIDDLPMMDSMTEVGEGMAFSTSAGRIADALASTKDGRKAILAFYSATLPQLGWSKTAQATFTREGEMLTLTFEVVDSLTQVQFSLKPY
ncbi:MAG: hypothetical protein OQK24_00500 [Magnetovibrio sp.]|nr:hypothetical protein [Magnetovibrio sp.]